MEDDFRESSGKPRKKMSEIMDEGYDPKTKALKIDKKHIK